MQIINHFKKQVNKSIDSLYQDNVITDDEMRESQKSTELSQNSHHSEILSHANNNNTQSQPSQLNPYAITIKPSQLPKASKCLACPKPAKYRCPQCLKPYCSAIHYKSHNLFCSESFYKRQVQTQMKSLKSTKQEQQQVRDMLKENNQARQQDSHLNLMTKERLVELLEMIENCEKEGRQLSDEMIKLSQGERESLEQFIKSMQDEGNHTHSQGKSAEKGINGSTQSNAMLETVSQPYWLIPDGLDYYFMQQLEIQQFSQSTHLSLIIYRQLLAKKYRDQIKPLNELIKTKPSPLVRQDILQYLIIWVLVNLAWNNQLNDKEEIWKLFENVYAADLPKNIKERDVNDEEAGAYTLAKLKQNIAGLKQNDTRNLVNSWYKASAISSAKIIVKNKYLLVQTLLRALQFFQDIEQQASTNETKNSKKRLNHALKHVKKLEFLLSYLKDQMQSKSQSTSQNLPKHDMFRHIYRTLTRQEENLVSQNEQQKDFIKQKVNVQQVKKHGILIQEIQ